MKIGQFEHSTNTISGYAQAFVVNGRTFGYNLIKGTVVETLAKHIQTLVEDNRRLTFWFSTSMLMMGAPAIFCGAGAIGLLSATQNHFGLRERRIEHLSWESTQGLMSGIVFVCGLLFHYHIQAIWGGFAAGSHIYRVWNGQVHADRIRGWPALDMEMHLLTNEFGKWVQAIIPSRLLRDPHEPKRTYALHLPLPARL